MADVLPAPAEAANAERGRPMLPVLEGGLATTVITLGLLYWLAHAEVDFDPMGLYVNLVIPFGAILVGLVAGSGYGIMSYLSGIKIRRGLLLTVIALQSLAYVGAEYASYLDVMNRLSIAADAEGDRFVRPSFVEYYQFKAENFAWKKKHSSDTGEPLGAWGYFFVGLAAVGFIGGGLIAPAICRTLPYCAGCQRYMKTKQLGLIPASIAFRKVKKKDTEGRTQYDAECAAAESAAEAHLKQLVSAAEANDIDAFCNASNAAFMPGKAAAKLPARVRTDLVHCRSCSRGWVRLTRLVGQGKETKSDVIARTEVGPEFATAVLARP